MAVGHSAKIQIRHEGVHLALGAEGGHGSVAGNEAHIIAEGKQLFTDGMHQRVEVSLGKIGAADRALKQHVAHHGDPGDGIEEHHMSGCVAGAMENLQSLVADGDGIAVLQPAVGREAVGERKAEHPALLRQFVDPEAVLALRPFDGQVLLARQCRDAAHMVEVPVGAEDFLQRDALFGDGGEEIIQVAAGVDQRAPHGFFAPDKTAILLVGRDGNDQKFHRGLRLLRSAGKDTTSARV